MGLALTSLVNRARAGLLRRDRRDVGQREDVVLVVAVGSFFEADQVRVRDRDASAILQWIRAHRVLGVIGGVLGVFGVGLVRLAGREDAELTGWSCEALFGASVRLRVERLVLIIRDHADLGL